MRIRGERRIQVFVQFILWIVTEEGGKSLQSIHLYIELSISYKEHLQTELKPKNRKTDKKDIIKTINKHANKITVSDTKSNERILSILPYVKGTIDRQSIKQTQYRIIFKSLKKIEQILRNPKDLRPQLRKNVQNPLFL